MAGTTRGVFMKYNSSNSRIEFYIGGFLKGYISNSGSGQMN